jgi:hypothetical protein
MSVNKRRLLPPAKLSRNTLAVMIAGFLVVGFAAVWWFASRAAQNPAADLNNDGQVNVIDLSMLLSNWTKTGTGDINSDGAVNITDLSILLSSWGVVTPSAYWTADWEEGPCTDKSCYSDWSFIQAEDSSQGVPSLNEVATASSLGITAHSGTDVGKFQTTQAALDAGRPHSKVFKEWQLPNSTPVTDEFGRALQSIPASGINGSYRAWYYIPSDYTFVGPEWTNIFQFKLSEQSPFVQDPQWWINIVGGASNQPYLHVENWGNGTFTDPGGTKAAPKGRWFEIRADLYEGNKIDWYLDGQFWQTVYHTTHKIGRGGATGTPRTWIFGVGHYGGIGRIYTDDASFTPSTVTPPIFDFDDVTPFTGGQSQQAFKYDFTPCSSVQGANNAQYASIVNDPAGVIDSKTGTTRKVIKMTTPNNAGGGTDSGARCQLEMWPMLQEGGEYWEALSWYFPADFPQQTTTPNWHALHGSYGTGATGNSPFRIDILNYLQQPDGTLGQRIYIVRKAAYNNEVLWEFKDGGVSRTVPQLRNKWVDVVLHYRVGRDKTGWMEIYTNTGSGWERQTFKPTTAHHTTTADGYRAYYATADPLSNGEPPYDTRINNYYMYNSYTGAGFPDPNTGPTIYHGVHRIGSTFASVSGSWSHANQASAPGP